MIHQVISNTCNWQLYVSSRWLRQRAAVPARRGHKGWMTGFTTAFFHQKQPREWRRTPGLIYRQVKCNHGNSWGHPFTINYVCVYVCARMRASGCACFHTFQVCIFQQRSCRWKFFLSWTDQSVSNSWQQQSQTCRLAKQSMSEGLWCITGGKWWVGEKENEMSRNRRIKHLEWWDSCHDWKRRRKEMKGTTVLANDGWRDRCSTKRNIWLSDWLTQKSKTDWHQFTSMVIKT